MEGVGVCGPEGKNHLFAIYLLERSCANTLSLLQEMSPGVLRCRARMSAFFGLHTLSNVMAGDVSEGSMIIFVWIPARAKRRKLRAQAYEGTKAPCDDLG